MFYIVYNDGRPVATPQPLSEEFCEAIRSLIMLCNYGKIATIKMLRSLQYQPERFTELATGKITGPLTNHALGLKDAKDIVEFVANYYGLTFK